MNAQPAERKAAHTPGPWTYAREMFDGDWLLSTQHADPEYRDIIEVNNANETDVRLIAAAPDLLAALQFVMSAHGEQLHEAFEAARAAIALAEGEV